MFSQSKEACYAIKHCIRDHERWPNFEKSMCTAMCLFWSDDKEEVFKSFKKPSDGPDIEEMVRSSVWNLESESYISFTLLSPVNLQVAIAYVAELFSEPRHYDQRNYVKYREKEPGQDHLLFVKHSTLVLESLRSFLRILEFFLKGFVMFSNRGCYLFRCFA